MNSKNLGRPDDSIAFDHGRSEWVSVDDVTVARVVLEPGWRWSEHIKPTVRTDWCESMHVGLMLAGRFGVRREDGSEYELEADDVYVIGPGHDGWVIGEEPVVQLEWSGVRGWAEPLETLNERVLATVLMTDIVDSTATLSRVGHARWQEMLSRHNAYVREVLARYRGREIKTTGDGFLVTFDGAARAVRCAAQLASASLDGIQIRAALHTGEVEFVGNDVRGVAVHETARVLGLAGAGEVVVSQVTRDLAVASGFGFDDRGTHTLKGIDGTRRVYALVR